MGRLTGSDDDLDAGQAKTLDEFIDDLDTTALETATGHAGNSQPVQLAGAHSLGCLLEASGDLEGAVIAYQRADERGSGPGACNLGVLLETSGDYMLAELAYARADARGNADGAENLARLLRRRGQHKEADAASQRAKQRRSEKMRAH